jgi:anti-sigma B factor antagonist
MSEFCISRLPGGYGLKVVGELDVATATQLSDALDDVTSQPDLVLDLSEVTFLDSCGVRSMLQATRTRNGAGPLVILNPSDAVTSLFDILALDQHPGIELRRTPEPPAQ